MPPRKAILQSVLIQELLALVAEDKKNHLEALQSKVSSDVRKQIAERIRQLNLARLREHAERCNRVGGDL